MWHILPTCRCLDTLAHLQGLFFQTGLCLQIPGTRIRRLSVATVRPTTGRAEEVLLGVMQMVAAQPREETEDHGTVCTLYR